MSVKTFEILGEPREIAEVTVSIKLAGDEPNSTLTLRILPEDLKVSQFDPLTGIADVQVSGPLIEASTHD